MTARPEFAPLRRLVVLRHAKSAWPDGVADHERPLAARGRRDAPAAGRLLCGTDCLPDLVLCSTAVRARETCELAVAEWGSPPSVRHEPRLYAADAAALLDVVRQIPYEIETLLVIGHNPGLADLVLTLAGEGLGDALDRLGTKFPTCAVAVLAWHGHTWRDLEAGAAVLTDLAVPRGRRP
ncbi:SixA phosphatase family protein [Streptomyces sp. NPDC094438]|uniref:SixA phosphatase family protein n=1 Tax=Streptomyces sp. NPDC094438 TaxID=3366061 RepID=UPI0038123D4D